MLCIYKKYYKYDAYILSIIIYTNFIYLFYTN